MEPFKAKGSKKNGPEAKIQQDLIDKLKTMDWCVNVTHGNEFQSGFPDLYAIHYIYGTRWIEVKNPLAYSFTDAQLRTFPLWEALGVGIWILTSAEPDELKKLFLPPNWHMYLSQFKTGLPKPLRLS